MKRKLSFFICHKRLLTSIALLIVLVTIVTIIHFIYQINIGVEI